MKKSNESGKNKSFDWLICLICLIPIVFFLLINAYCYDFYYDLNDDVMLRDLLSGVFAGSPLSHTIHMKYPFTFALSVLYRVAPGISWFGLIEIICIALSNFIINLSFCKQTKDRLLQCFIASCITVVFQTILIYQSVFVQYSVVSGILSGAGIAWLFFIDYDKDNKHLIKDYLVSVILFSLSLCIRDQMFMFSCPFICFALLTKFLLTDVKQRKDFVKKTILFIILIGVSALTIIGVHKIAYSSKEWRDYRVFNDYRTTLYDYQKDAPWYMFHPEIYDELGFSESEAQIVVDTNLSFTDKINTDILEKIVEYNSNTLGKKYFTVNYKEAIKYYIYTLHKTKECKYCFLIIALYVLLIIVAIIKKRMIYIPISAFLFVIRSIDWMYLILRDRLKDRVTVPLCFFEIMIIVCLLFNLAYEEKKTLLLIATLCIMMSIMYPMFKRNIKDTNEEAYLRAQTDKGWEEFKTYCRNNYDNFYVLDLISNITFSEKIFDGNRPMYANYVLCGGWTSKSPIYREKLKKRNITSIDEALLDREDVYFISMYFRDTDWLTGYYKDRGYDVSCDEIDRIYINDSQYYVVYGVNY